MKDRIITAIMGGLLIGAAGLGIGFALEYDVFLMLIALPIIILVAATGLAWVCHAAWGGEQDEA